MESQSGNSSIIKITPKIEEGKRSVRLVEEFLNNQE